MVDGTGMCGGCRVSIDNKPKFVCVDGPEFDGHLVDYNNLMQRLKTYTSNGQDPRLQSVGKDSSCWKPPEDRAGTAHKPSVSMHATEGHAVIDQLAEGLSGPTTGAEKAGAKLDDHIVYSRFDIYTLNFNTFLNCINNKFPFVRRTQAGFTVSIAGNKLRKKREEMGSERLKGLIKSRVNFTG